VHAALLSLLRYASTAVSFKETYFLLIGGHNGTRDEIHQIDLHAVTFFIHYILQGVNKVLEPLGFVNICIVPGSTYKMLLPEKSWDSEVYVSMWKKSIRAKNNVVASKLKNCLFSLFSTKKISVKLFKGDSVTVTFALLPHTTKRSHTSPLSLKVGSKPSVQIWIDGVDLN
jgi:hypothetical protein